MTGWWERFKDWGFSPSAKDAQLMAFAERVGKFGKEQNDRVELLEARVAELEEKGR